MGGSVLNSLAGTPRAAPRLPESVLEDCTAVDQQAMGQLQSRDSALYACVTAIKVAHPPQRPLSYQTHEQRNAWSACTKGWREGWWQCHELNL